MSYWAITISVHCQKTQNPSFWGWHPAWKMVCWGGRVAIHCLRSVAIPLYVSIKEVGHFWAKNTHHNKINYTTTTMNCFGRFDFRCICMCTLSVTNGVLLYNESHTLLMNYLKTLFEYLYKKEDVYKVMYMPYWWNIRLWSSGFIAKNIENARFWSSLSAWQIEWWGARK